jgi:DNA-binding transcriptional LysR family regulator
LAKLSLFKLIAQYIKNNPKLKTPEDLTRHNCIIYSLSDSPTQWTCGKAGIQKIVNISPGSYTVNNGLALTQAAVSSLGVILMPEILIKSELKSKLLLPLLPEWEFESYALYAIYPYHRETSHKLRTLIDFLVHILSN